MVETQAKYTFQFLTGKKFPSLEGKDENETYFKWSLKGRMVAQTFSFDQQFQAYQKDDFALAFFQDPEVLRNLKVVSNDCSVSPLGIKAAAVKAEPLATSQTSMTFFDRLTENNLLRDNGYIQKCYDVFHEDMLLSHEVGQMLALEDSDNYGLYSPEDRKELLFWIFRLLVLGGRANQYDNEIENYYNLTRKIYKDFVNVQKDPSTGEIRVISHVYNITALDGEGRPYYPSDQEYPHVQDFTLLIVDPLKRNATVFAHKFGYSPGV